MNFLNDADLDFESCDWSRTHLIIKALVVLWIIDVVYKMFNPCGFNSISSVGYSRRTGTTDFGATIFKAWPSNIAHEFIPADQKRFSRIGVGWRRNKKLLRTGG
jgi:hypothetical protein